MLKFLFCLTMVASCVTATPSGRIFNGSIQQEVRPYHAQLLISNSVNATIQFMGSGTLVTRIHVLTAALNIVGFNQWQAGFGSLDFNLLTYYQATGAVVHEDYNPTNTLNNIGVIFFGNGVFPIDDKNIAPIALPSAVVLLPAAGASGSFSSFGFQTPTGSPSTVLLTSTQTVLGDQNCASIFTWGDLSGQFCAIDATGFSSPCAGEQGSAFVVDNDGGPLAVGLVSATVGQCDSISAVTFYIRITDYRLWLSSRFGI